MADHPSGHRSVVKRRKVGSSRTTAHGSHRKESATTIARQNQTAAERLVRKSGGNLNIATALKRIRKARSEREKRQEKKGR